MRPSSFRHMPAPSRLRWMASIAWICLLLAAGSGCALPMSCLLQQGPPVPSVVEEPPLLPVPFESQTSQVVQAGYVAADSELPELPPPAPGPSAHLSVDLPTVLRFVDEKNAQLARARAKIAEAEATASVAAHSCIPDALRHEQNRRAATEARLWQARAEAAQTCADLLQQAGSAYYDWLVARRAESIARELQRYEEKLVPNARAWAKEEPRTDVLLQGILTSLHARQQSVTKYHQQAEAAAGRLAYLMGVPDAILVPLESELMPIKLVALQSPAALLQQAESNGPGVHEYESLQATLEQALADAHCLQTGCRLTGRCTLCGRLEAIEAKIEQVRQTRADLAGKIEAGVREAHAEIVAGPGQIAEANRQAEQANHAYDRAEQLLNEFKKPDNINDVLGAIHGLESANFGRIDAVSTYNKAQVRLQVLLGLAGCHFCP